MISLSDLTLQQAALHTYKIAGRIRKIGATNLLLAASKNGTECDEFLLQMFFSLTSTEVSPTYNRVFLVCLMSTSSCLRS